MIFLENYYLTWNCNYGFIINLAKKNYGFIRYDFSYVIYIHHKSDMLTIPSIFEFK